MWNKRKEEEFAPKSAAPPTSAELGREGIPMSTLPGRLTEPEAPRGVATIGKSVVLKGQIFSREDLYVDGEVDGTIELLEHRLTLGPHAKVSAAIKVREVVIMGAVRGNIEATDKIDIRKDAKPCSGGLQAAARRGSRGRGSALAGHGNPGASAAAAINGPCRCEAVASPEVPLLAEGSPATTVSRQRARPEGPARRFRPERCQRRGGGRRYILRAA